MWHICHTLVLLSDMVKKTADDAARELLFRSDSDREAHAMAVQALLARNALLTALETARAEQGLTKAESWRRAQVSRRRVFDVSSRRRRPTRRLRTPSG